MISRIAPSSRSDFRDPYTDFVKMAPRGPPAGLGRVGQRLLRHPIGGVVRPTQEPPRELGPAPVQVCVVLPGRADPPVDRDAGPGRVVRGLLACEPRRSRLALGLSHLVWLLGCGPVTYHDAVISVRAGFTGDDLTTLWPQGGWQLSRL